MAAMCCCHRRMTGHHRGASSDWRSPAQTFDQPLMTVQPAIEQSNMSAKPGNFIGDGFQGRPPGRRFSRDSLCCFISHNIIRLGFAETRRCLVIAQLKPLHGFFKDLSQSLMLFHGPEVLLESSPMTVMTHHLIGTP